MINALIITSVLGFIMGIFGSVVGVIALIKMMAMEKSTHTIQMEPVNNPVADQYFTDEQIDEMDDESNFGEIPTKDLEKHLMEGLT